VRADQNDMYSRQAVDVYHIVAYPVQHALYNLQHPRLEGSLPTSQRVT